LILVRGSVIFFAVFFLTVDGLAQVSLEQMEDSLVQARTQNNTMAVGMWLSNIGGWYIEGKQWDSAEYYHRQSLQWNTRHQHQRLIGVNLNDIGVVFEYRRVLDSAIYYYEMAVAVLDESGDLEIANRTKHNLGTVYKNVGLYPEALEVTMNAALFYENKAPSLDLAKCYTTMALVYTKLNDLQPALSFHRKSIGIYRLLDANSMSLARACNNIAITFQELKQYDSAMYYYQRSVKLKRAAGEIGSMASTLHNIGDLLVETQKPLDAEPYYHESLALKSQWNNQSGKVPTFTSLAKVSLLMGQHDRAEAYLDSAEQIARRVGMLEELKLIYEFRVQAGRETGNYRSAFDHSLTLAGIKDSLLTAAKIDELRAITTKYEVGRIERDLNLERQLRYAEMKEKKTWIMALAFIILLLSVIGLLIFLQFRTARKNKARVELLLKELHHRVKNNLQILSSVLTFQSQELTDKGAIEAIKNSESRLNAMALIHRKLYRTDHNRTIAMKEYIQELIEFLLYSNGYTYEKLQLTIDIDDFELDVDRAIPLGLIINELVNNAFKHAITKQASPALTVRSKFLDKDVRITISDNGLCPPNPSDELTSFGLKMVDALLHELRGSMESGYHEGTTFQLNIPT
jgi:two-component sensor histidine kinase